MMFLVRLLLKTSAFVVINVVVAFRLKFFFSVGFVGLGSGTGSGSGSGTPWFVLDVCSDDLIGCCGSGVVSVLHLVVKSATCMKMFNICHN